MRSTSLVTIARENKVFFSFYLILAVLGIYPLLAWDKVTLLLMINSQYHPLLDQFFYYITHLGSNITYALLLFSLMLLKVTNRKLLIGGISFVVMAVIVQFLKKIAFPDQLRPIELVPDAMQLHLIDAVKILGQLSFPSGHAATVFTAACLLNLISPTKNSLYSLLLLVIAIIVAYSRVYLCQHFYTDVYAGMLIGGLVPIFVYAWFIDWRVPSWLAHKLPVKI
jgi:membrane-associated phospholipid phosphatase